MKSSALTLTLFVCLAAVQLAVPLWMVGAQEWTLRNGEVFRFETAPVDPADVMRGRYVALRFKESQAPVGNLRLERGDAVHALLSRDAQGFAHITGLSLKAVENVPSFPCKVQYVGGGNLAILDIPFDRFYLNEKDAPRAEQLYRDRNRATNLNRKTYVTVRVRSGHATLENLYIDGKPLEHYLRDQ